MEQAQAGDKCDFIGTLIVVPDVSKLQVPGKLKVWPFDIQETSVSIMFFYEMLEAFFWKM